MPRLQIPLALPLILFFVSAVLGTIFSYVPLVALTDLGFILVGIGLYVGIVQTRHVRQFRLGAVLLLLLSSAALVVLFITAHDFEQSPIKFSALNKVGLLFQGLVPSVPIPSIHPNHLAGILELALPINVALSWHLMRQKQWAKAAGATGLALVIGFGLFLSGSRGAWFGLVLVGAVLIGVQIVVDVARTGRVSSSIRLALPVILFPSLVFAFYFRESLGPISQKLVRLVEALPGEIPRPELYQQIWGLIQDYLFTGSGLGTFPMVYATYALQMNVFILPHAHNILFQIWIEQGLLGVVAFVWLILAFYLWTWKHRPDWTWLTLGGLAATTVMLVHGLVDAALWYNDGTRILLFAPLAMTIAGTRGQSGYERMSLVPVAVGFLLVLGLMIVSKPLLAMWFSDLGSLAQARVELGRYHFPDSLVEYTRREGDLSEAEGYLRQALELDPNNVTANQRLGMIALARGEYGAALAFGQAAYSRDASNPITLQILGDASLAQGDQAAAYFYWAQVQGAESKLGIEAAIRYDRTGDQVRAQWTRELAKRIGATR